MPPNYDVFLSYSSADKDWAIRLEQALTAASLEVFRDKSRLAAGDLWDAGLRTALDNSRHLVGLWSAQAKASDWVTKELIRFEMLRENDPKRRLILVNLEGQNQSLTAYQAIEDLKLAGSYPGAPEAVEPNLWNRVVGRIVDAVRINDERIPIVTAVLTLTAGQLEGLAAADLSTIETELGVQRAALDTRYGTKQLDWRPYGGAATIETMLDELVHELNKAVQASGIGFRWEPVADALWQDLATGKPYEAAAALAHTPLPLVIVDVIALKRPEVLQRCLILREHTRSETAAWVIVPPLASEPRMLSYRNLVRAWTAPLLESYLEPPLPNPETHAPQYSIYCGDSAEIRRMIRTVAGRYIASRPPLAASSAFLRLQA